MTQRSIEIGENFLLVKISVYTVATAYQYICFCKHRVDYMSSMGFHACRKYVHVRWGKIFYTHFKNSARNNSLLLWII